MVPKGKFDWYSPDKSLSQAANSIFNQLTNIDQLPYPIMMLKQMVGIEICIGCLLQGERQNKLPQ